MKTPELFPCLLQYSKIKEEVTSTASVASALRHTHLRWAVVLQFFYVGEQVCVFSFFILYVTEAAGINEPEAVSYAVFGFGMAFMIGRFVGTFFMRIDYAVKSHQNWYLGDGMYGDGPDFHWDYYDSFAIQPMLLDVTNIVVRDEKRY